MKQSGIMKSFLRITSSWFIILALPCSFLSAHPAGNGKDHRTMQFPDIPGYLTLKCDLHMHTVFSDGDVWPVTRVEEALREGLDVISITDHLEYQPHESDLTNPDRNRSYTLAVEAAKNTGLVVVNGVEITRSMPPGHFNAIFVKDANELIREDVFEVLREAREQGAYVFWNHPNWITQKQDGVAGLSKMHLELLEEELFQGIEIYNGGTYSAEALGIAARYRLTPMGNSDTHGVIEWEYPTHAGKHRPVTLVFAKERTKESIKEAFFQGQTVVWFDQTLVGIETFLVPLIEQSLTVTRMPGQLVETILIDNDSDTDLILENRSRFSFHNLADVFVLKAHESTAVKVKTLTGPDRYELSFAVLNAFTVSGDHPEIALYIQ